MKARSRNAPYCPTPPRPLPARNNAEIAAPGPDVAWNHWLDRLPASRRDELLPFRLTSLAAPRIAAQRNEATLPPLVRAAVTGCAAGLPVAPSRTFPGCELFPAVRHALQTPDLFLWNRGKNQDVSTLTAEILCQAARHGARVLYLAASPAPLERTLAKLAADPTFLAVRFSAPGERSPNGLLTRYALDEQRAALRGRLLARATQARADFEARRVCFEIESVIWESLSAEIREIASYDARCRELADRLDRLGDEVRREAEALIADSTAASGPFSADFACAVKNHGERIGVAERSLFLLRDQLTSLDHALAEMARERERLQPILAPFRDGRWWTISYWKIRFNAELQRHDRSVADNQRSLVGDRERVASALAAAEIERQTALDGRSAEVRSLVAAEVGRRRGELAQQLDLLQSRRADAVANWRQLHDRLTPGHVDPAEPTLETHAQAYKLWQDRERNEAPLAGLALNPQDIVSDFLKQMPFLAPVITGTTLALARDPDFTAAVETPFDFVILDDADRLADADLLAILGHAPRALIIGSAVSQDSPFAKLWRVLHRCETPSTYRWSRLEAGYLCTLRPLTAADQPFVESERLADFPEIELRILSIPKHPPRLAEVIFPASMSAVEAKAFIYRELQEAAVDRVDRPKQFRDDPGRFTIVWECPASPAEEMIDLEPGLREAICVHGNQLTTCRIEFDKSAGWDSVKIDDWLRRHLPTFDAPRTADLVK